MANENGGVHLKSKYFDQLMVWLGACSQGLTKPIIFKQKETLKHNNYIDVVLTFALEQGIQLLGDNFIFQQDSEPAHRHYQSQAWCKKHFPDYFFNKDRWSANSPDLNVLDYYVWDVIGQQMRWKKSIIMKHYGKKLKEP